MSEDLLSKRNIGERKSEKNSCKSGNDSKEGKKTEDSKHNDIGGFDTAEEYFENSTGNDVAGVEANNIETVDLNAAAIRKIVEAETANLVGRLQRAQADFINYKKRIEQMRLQDKTRYEGRLILDLLPILDNLERAISVECHDETGKNFIKGLDLIIKQFKDLLFKKGLKEIPALDKQFDPHRHEAVEQVMDKNIKENLIVEVLRKGYMFEERVLRPSLVKVNIGGMEDE